MKRWFCVVCGYVHEGDAPPDSCPVCGVGPEEFQLIGGSEDRFESALPQRIVVVGNGVAGHQAAQAARRQAPDASIRLLAAEPHHHYNRLGLTLHLAGAVPRERLFLANDETYRDLRIEVFRSDPVVAIDRDAATVTTKRGETYPYDRLVLCTGASVWVPPAPGIDHRDVIALRTLDDVDRLAAAAPSARHAIAIGGGLLGLEAAFGLRKRGAASVTVVEAAPRLLARQLDDEGARFFEPRVRALGIDVRTGTTVTSVEGDPDGALRAVHLSDGTELTTSLVVVGTGIRSELALARAAGLAVGRGILVDDHLRTSDVRVFAAGDAAEYRGTVYGLWSTSMLMGGIAGTNAAGGDQALPELTASTFLKVMGIDVFSIGPAADPVPDSTVLRDTDAAAGVYRKLVVRDGKVIAGILLGDVRRAIPLRNAVEKAIDVHDRLGSDSEPAGQRIDRILGAV